MPPQAHSLLEFNQSTVARKQPLSFLTGPTDVKLWDVTVGQLLKQQAIAHPSRECVVFPETNQRLTYEQLYLSSLAVSKGLLAAGVQRGQCVGILAGNCLAYVELLFATAHIGAIYVVLNSSYTAAELKSAVRHSECRLLFTAPTIGKQSNNTVLEMLSGNEISEELPKLRKVVLVKPGGPTRFINYQDFVDRGRDIPGSYLQSEIDNISSDDICNLQFTSGTTGNPKAAMLTHSNIVNNGRFVGDRMRLTPKDILACPPPLFHCFGLVLGLIASVTHGSSTVFPSETFDPVKTLQAVSKEECTALHGVPAMFSAQLELKAQMEFPRLRTGIAAGAPVPQKMMEDLHASMNLLEITNTYGMTETSPASFMTFTDDPIEKRLKTVGRILPHMKAKIIDTMGNIVPLGSRGELCVAGFALQKGYWQNSEKTAEVMITDANGILWMHTGDEAIFDEEGYCQITGRIKDIIIRGGENIFPLEIEERLVQHPTVIQASVVGLTDQKYGEVVCAFLEPRRSHPRPSLNQIRDFVREKLGWHKAPVHVFWLGEGEDFPKTGSGKIQKHILKSQGENWLKRGRTISKL
ncbi:putative long-chain-fatty-acid-CoA ligase [Tricladium varicosporioides]|nr:putative long-chain-fatty-acid-CoA ligase [Hymenoscyphus varicosporioides]